MSDSATSGEFRVFQYRHQIQIDAPMAVTFGAVLDELGPACEMPDGRTMSMKFEAWPGGRWFRDLGNGAGHLWGHVQVIKPPRLIEIRGPLFMSYPSENFVQYRLEESGAATRLSIVHRAMGLIPPGDAEGVSEGWEHGLRKISEIAAQRMVAART